MRFNINESKAKLISVTDNHDFEVVAAQSSQESSQSCFMDQKLGYEAIYEEKTSRK